MAGYGNGGPHEFPYLPNLADRRASVKRILLQHRNFPTHAIGYAIPPPRGTPSPTSGNPFPHLGGPLPPPRGWPSPTSDFTKTGRFSAIFTISGAFRRLRGGIPALARECRRGTHRRRTGAGRASHGGGGGGFPDGIRRRRRGERRSCSVKCLFARRLGEGWVSLRVSRQPMVLRNPPARMPHHVWTKTKRGGAECAEVLAEEGNIWLGGRIGLDTGGENRSLVVENSPLTTAFQAVQMSA